MDELAGRVAVVTGAASGIGRGLADRFAAEGMKVVLADIEPEPLRRAERALADAGHEVIAVTTDVSSKASVDTLADEAYARFGAVHVLCNNAGVSGGGGPLWNTTSNDWSWVLGVNLMGVVHGVQAFVGRMIAGGDEGHVVNTSSVLGLSTGGGGIYSITKHAVTRLSEGLHYDLRAAGAPINVSVLCPGMIATNIITAARNRPEHLRNEGAAAGPDQQRMMQAVAQRFQEQGMPPAEVAEIVVKAIRENTFYVLTHPEQERTAIERRFRGMLDNQLPEQPPMGRALGVDGREAAGRTSG